MKKNYSSGHWKWIPSLYFIEGLPWAITMIVSVVLYKNLNISNSDIALYTSWLYLPWVIKPFWSPIIDTVSTKRSWIIGMQLLIGCCLALIGLTIPLESFFKYTLVFFWLIAFSSATQDIAADGLYLLSLSSHDQAWYIGIRNTFYRLAIITGQGLIIIIVGYLTDLTGQIYLAWSLLFFSLAVTLFISAFYHYKVLPKTEQKRTNNSSQLFQEFYLILKSFFLKPSISISIIFILIYRFGEAQLVKIAPLFMLDSLNDGGLGLSNVEYGFLYGTLGTACLTIGGIVGGILIAKQGLKFWIVWMALAMKLPDIVYVYMAHSLPSNKILIGTLVCIEQFGYGFGFTAYLLYMMMISEGKNSTSHYAICTGIMAMGMMVPGMFSGMIQESFGYFNFFIWVILSTIPGLIMIKFLSIKQNYGRNKA